MNNLVKYLLIFVLLNICDLILTLQALNNGCEIMPVMKYLMELNIFVFCVFKIVGSALIAYLIYKIKDRKWLARVNVSKALVIGMCLICCVNIFTILVGSVN